jgi:PAS domain S-box-containing protein
MKVESIADKLAFLAEGGEMGKLIRTKDWSNTEPGNPENWPQSLRTTLSIILNSGFPMFLWWGENLIQFYNDAYRPSLGNDGKHPNALGQKGEDCWQEIWPIIKPLIESVKKTGKATWSENQLIPIYRNGHLEDVYWTFSYSPVKNEDGHIEGVLVVCNETTEQINTLQKLKDSERHFRNLIKESPISTSLLTGPEFIIEVANEEALHLWGKDKSIIGKKLMEAMPELKGQPYIKILEDVYKTGKTYYGNENLAYLKIDGKLKPVYVNFIYKALQNADGKIWGIISMGYEVTEQLEARRKVEESEERARLAVDSALLGTFDLNIQTDQIVGSKRFAEIFGFKRSDVSHDEFIKTIHPNDLHIRDEAIKHAIEKEAISYEVRIIWPDKSIHWINVKGKIFFDDEKKPLRVLGTVIDITPQKNLLQSFKASEKKFRDTVKQAPVGITILRGPQYIVELANDAYLQVIDRKENEFVGKPLFEGLPEVEEAVHKLLDDVLQTGNPFHGIEYPIPVNRYGKQELSYFDFLYYPLREEDGKISGIIVTVTDVSVSVKAKHFLAESEKQFRNLVMQSPIPMAIFRGKDYVIEMANAIMFENIWRKKESDVLGKKALEVFPELNDQKYPELLQHVFTTGKSHRENESLAYVLGNDGMKKFYLDYEYSPLFDTDNSVSAIIITVNDVTEKVEARQKVEHAEERLRLAIAAADMGTFDWDLETQDFFSSDRLKEIFGFKRKDDVTHIDLINTFHPQDAHIREEAVKKAFETGRLNYEIRIIWPDKSIHWIRVYGKTLQNLESGALLRMYGTVIDITEQKTIFENLKENEKKFRLLADSMPQMIWTGDAEGTLNYFNQSVFDYSGLNLKQIMKDGWIEIVHPEDRQENIAQWMHSVSTGEDFIYEHRFKKNNGEYRWQLSRAVPQKDSLGNIRMWVGTSTDIQDQKMFSQELEKKILKRTEELKQINKELKKSEERYHSMIDEVQDYAILYLNRNGTIENWNKGAEKIKGYKAEEIIGKNFSIFYTDEDRQKRLPETLLEKAVKSGKATHEGWRKRKDGSLFWGNIVITALHDSDDNIIGFSKVTRDLTEKKKADDEIKMNAEQLEQKNAELQKVNTELESFAYVSSHDLQEPLRKIQTFSTRIIEKDYQTLSDTAKDYFNRLQNAAKRMQVLIQDLLIYSRTNSTERIFENTDIKTLIEEVKDDLKENLLQKNADIEIIGTSRLNIIPFQFRQLMQNLITNSIKFSRPDQPPHIVIKSETKEGEALNNNSFLPDKKYCHIKFSDNGIGFEPQYSERIFEVFQRLHGKDEYQGTGIGLAIVKKIVENHNGKITATGEPGKGTTFDIYFPAD